jgi:hypothetical protein
VKELGMIFLSSGRTPYLKATIGSILRSKVDLTKFDIHIVANYPLANYEFIKKNENVSLHIVDDTSHPGLVKYAFNLGLKYENCFFIEEDWLFNKNLSTNDLHLLLKIQNVRQIVFSKHRLGHETESSNVWGSSKSIKIDGWESQVLKLDTYFSLNPTLVKREVLQEICNNFDWLQPNNSGPSLEINLNKLLNEKFGPTLLIPSNPKYKVTHLGILSGTKYFKMISENHETRALFIMHIHTILLKIKYSNSFLSKIYIPNKYTKFLER